MLELILSLSFAALIGALSYWYLQKPRPSQKARNPQKPKASQQNKPFDKTISLRTCREGLAFAHTLADGTNDFVAIHVYGEAPYQHFQGSTTNIVLQELRRQIPDAKPEEIYVIQLNSPCLFLGSFLRPSK